MVGEVGDVGPASRGEVVDTDDLVAPRQEVVAEVRADESRAAEDDDASVHRRPIPT